MTSPNEVARFVTSLIQSPAAKKTIVDTAAGLRIDTKQLTQRLSTGEVKVTSTVEQAYRSLQAVSPAMWREQPGSSQLGRTVSSTHQTLEAMLREMLR